MHILMLWRNSFCKPSVSFNWWNRHIELVFDQLSLLFEKFRHSSRILQVISVLSGRFWSKEKQRFFERGSQNLPTDPTSSFFSLEKFLFRSSCPMFFYHELYRCIILISLYFAVAREERDGLRQLSIERAIWSNQRNRFLPQLWLPVLWCKLRPCPSVQVRGLGTEKNLQNLFVFVNCVLLFKFCFFFLICRLPFFKQY
jgi:hypothetical protein